MSILHTIVAHKREEVEARKASTSQEALVRELPRAPVARDFRAALTSPDQPSPTVIAEIKRRSPSKGALKPDLDPVAVARIYEQNGAAAVSVLTDSRFFGGSLDDLRAVRAAIGLPVLCKEFIIDPYQIYEARLAGADAILLIADALPSDDLREFRLLAATLGMASLVEVHNRAQLEAALASGADIIGVNNRDLHTFAVNLATTGELLPLLPGGTICISESGIRTVADRAYMASIGLHALLIGESLLVAPDTGVATRLMCGLDAPVLEKSLP